MNEAERLAAACMFPSFEGAEAPDWARRFLADGGGGFVLFAYNVPSRAALAALCASLRAERDDVLLALDEEGGDVTRLEWQTGSSYPGGAALGVVDDLAATEAVAGALAAELASAGVNWNLAPVADVNAPGNPVIGTRAYGGDAALVARHVGAFVRGTQALHVAACAKHFPGHGATTQDSHLELPTIDGDVRDGLEPFRAAIAADVRAIMTAHVCVPALDGSPATLSHRIVTGLLREDLGYDGMVVSDALDMRAVSGAARIEETAVRALLAGVDALCLGHGLSGREAGALVTALAERVPERRLREAAGRIAAVAAWARPDHGEADRSVGASTARRAVHTRGETSFGERPRVIELRPGANIAAGEAVHALTGTVVREGEPVPPADVFVVRDAHLHPWMRAAADVPGAVVVETGLPVWQPTSARGHIVTHGGSRASLDVVAELLA